MWVKYMYIDIIIGEGEGLKEIHIVTVLSLKGGGHFFWVE